MKKATERPNAKKTRPTQAQNMTIRKPQEASRPIFIEAKPEASSYSLQEYQAAIEADRERFAHDWNDSSLGFFAKLLGKE